MESIISVEWMAWAIALSGAALLLVGMAWLLSHAWRQAQRNRLQALIERDMHLVSEIVYAGSSGELVSEARRILAEWSQVREGLKRSDLKIPNRELERMRSHQMAVLRSRRSPG